MNAATHQSDGCVRSTAASASLDSERRGSEQEAGNRRQHSVEARAVPYETTTDTPLTWPASIVFQLGSMGMVWIVPAVGNVALTA
jgi:hypothetical protein